MEAVIVPEIAAPIEMCMKEVCKLPYIRNLKLAHRLAVNDKFEVQLLIGADYYWSFVEDNIRGNGPITVKSKLGYLLSGPINRKSTNQGASTATLHILSHRENVEYDLERFWKLETLGISTEENDESMDAKIKHYQENNIYFRDNKYYAILPWKNEYPELPTNENIAKKRTANVVKRLTREPKMLEIYGDIIRDQESRGFVEKVPTEEISTKKQIHYIPHHPVKKDSITTPIRIVYDCSCRQDGSSPSLNDCLSSDPPILIDLPGILTRFRAKKYGISTDIEKAFLQINLDENDKDVTRFFWLEDPRNPNNALIACRFRSVLFGATCSPFILSATLMKHVSDNPSETTDTIRRDIYVDNILTSVNTEDDARKFFHESRKLFLGLLGLQQHSSSRNSENRSSY
ncbi:uncharacterized protein LOC125658566 [Ostrea edulis]|uniref:uncharacterized protein LOC125658566 n=1 Tax=Ostrea edulis TaxID=37623 RepID=UPI0024AF79C4|nr:uncharacterized protein LOC125658566 [Ostrea edulis]